MLDQPAYRLLVVEDQPENPSYWKACWSPLVSKSGGQPMGIDGDEDIAAAAVNSPSLIAKV
ncbi:MAG: hypothetical protein VX293_12675 [Candidatus Latescibacterota bacterium]|nr:hypothetical protein [Candidatus Latescibacterota bacterium]